MTFPHVQIARLFALAADTTKAVNERGKALEELLTLLMAEVPGVTVFATNSLDVFRSQEVDLVLANNQHEDGLVSFGREVLVECKNWKDPVGASEVAWLYTKLRTRGLSHGILVAMNGITGDGFARTSANSILAHALSEQIRIVVLTRVDLEAVHQGSDLTHLCRQRELALLSTRGLPG
jgi:hypothetical protein